MMENAYVETKNNSRTALVVDRVRQGDEEVSAGWHQFVPASAVEGCVRRIASYYNENRTSMHPIAAATYLFYEMITVHPFPNGNGRLCRMLMAWSLLKDGFPFPVSFSSGHSKRRRHYLHAIEAARKPVFGHRGELNTTLLVSMERVMGNYLENERLLMEGAEGTQEVQNA
jgi:Fic family protein